MITDIMVFRWVSPFSLDKKPFWTKTLEQQWILLAEKILFAALDKRRIDSAHEMFDVTPTQLSSGFAAVIAAFDSMRVVNDFLPIVKYVDVAMIYDGIASRQQKRVADVSDRASESNITNSEKELASARKNAKQQERTLRQKEKQERNRLADMQEDIARQKKMKEFLDSSCKKGEGLEVGSLSLLSVFNKLMNLDWTSQILNAQMRTQGFATKHSRSFANRCMAFQGLALADKGTSSP